MSTKSSRKKKQNAPISSAMSAPSGINLAEIHLYTLAEYLAKHRHSRDLHTMITYIHDSGLRTFKTPFDTNSEVDLLSRSFNISKQLLRDQYAHGISHVLAILAAQVDTYGTSRIIQTHSTTTAPQLITERVTKYAENDELRVHINELENYIKDTDIHSEADPVLGIHFAKINILLDRVSSVGSIPENITTMTILGKAVDKLRMDDKIRDKDFEHLENTYKKTLGYVANKITDQNIEQFELGVESLPPTYRGIWDNRIQEEKEKTLHRETLQQRSSKQRTLLGISDLDIYREAAASEAYEDDTRGVMEFKEYVLTLQHMKDRTRSVSQLFKSKLQLCNTLEKMRKLEKQYITNTQVDIDTWELFNFKLELMLEDNIRDTVELSGADNEY